MRLSLAVAVAAALFVTPVLGAKIDLAGQVTYRERIALPDHATLEIQIVDQSLPSLPPRLDVKAPIGKGQVPLSFNLNFDDAIVTPTHSYALIASISVGGGLLFRNFEPYVVNPRMPAQPVLIVTNLVGQTAAANSSSAEPASPAAPALLDSVWTLTMLNGAPVQPRTRLSLSVGADMRAGGSGGCNSWFAQAEIKDDALRFGGITSTLKGCTQSVNLQEAAFKDALGAVATWSVTGDQLTLFGADGKALLVFTR